MNLKLVLFVVVIAAFAYFSTKPEDNNTAIVN